MLPIEHECITGEHMLSSTSTCSVKAQERGKVTGIWCGVRAKSNVPPQLRSQHAVERSTPLCLAEEAAATKDRVGTRELWTSPVNRADGAQIEDRLVSDIEEGPTRSSVHLATPTTIELTSTQPHLPPAQGKAISITRIARAHHLTVLPSSNAARSVPYARNASRPTENASPAPASPSDISKTPR